MAIRRTRVVSKFRGEVVGRLVVLQHPGSSGGHGDADLRLVSVRVDEARDRTVVVKDAKPVVLIVLNHLQLAVVSVDRIGELK